MQPQSDFGPNPEPHVLEDPPPYHYKLLDYGERPYWSPDGKKIAFVEQNYGDICEMDFETREVRNLTKNLGDHHSFLRVLFLKNGDYLLIGPKEFKDRHISRHVESELWWMDKDASNPPLPIGQAIYEGCGVSKHALRITYSVNGDHDPSLGGPDKFECRVSEIIIDSNGAHLGDTRPFYTADGGHRPEPQDFRHNDSEVIMAEYLNRRKTHPDNHKCVVKGVEVETGKVTTYVDEWFTHNEPEGIFPDEEHICLESSNDADRLDVWNKYNAHTGITDLWKLKLDGSGRRVRMTQFYQRPPWRATNSNVSPDGRWLAYMVSIHTDEAGYGRGLGLLDLHEWEKTPEGQSWEIGSVTG